ncbi:S66 peptidase family protein [Microlunatus sp. GCM10028923]|uniref:S66 family peptidase n=1 Tax=Microlunatus sp. GCM10028923 TaxID=3273400 RepID=UPI00360D6141
MDLLSPPKARPGDKVAVLSPSFAAPAIAPTVHEQALERLASLTGLVPVEFPTTRKLDASPRERADDLNAAFGDRSIRGLVTTLGGDDQLTVIPYLNSEALINDPKPFLGYSDSTNLLHWMWTHGVAGFHGGSTQLQLGPGPEVDPIQARSLRAALITGERLELTEPGESEDFGRDWADPRALVEFGDRHPTEPWHWAGPSRAVTGPSWGGCIEVLQWMLTAGRFPNDPSALRGAVLLLESSEDLIPAREFGRILRSLGERGILAVIAAVVVARPPATSLTLQPTEAEQRGYRRDQRDVAVDVVASYNPEAVVVVGPPFGHTRPQWIVPYGGPVTVDGLERRLFADYR